MKTFKISSPNSVNQTKAKAYTAIARDLAYALAGQGLLYDNYAIGIGKGSDGSPSLVIYDHIKGEAQQFIEVFPAEDLAKRAAILKGQYQLGIQLQEEKEELVMSVAAGRFRDEKIDAINKVASVVFSTHKIPYRSLL